jgi:hypothetical protein
MRTTVVMERFPVTQSTKYFYNPSLMKNHKKYLGGGSNITPHPAINKNSPTQMITDLGRIQNE